MQRGHSLTQKDSVFGRIPVISGGREPAFYCNKSNRTGNTITVAGSGAGAGYVQYFSTPIYANDCFTLQGCKDVNTKYVYYCMLNMQERITNTKKGSGVPHCHISDIEDFVIPIPPLSVQEHIVEVLDRFNDLCTNISSGLPAEIEMRKKQYEYYRNELLTFKRKETAV